LKKPKEHYVNNAELYKAMVAYKKDLKKALKEETIVPRIPNYIGECIMKIATHLAHRPNFSNYTFKDEMVSDGIENCLLYINNFDPKKSKNPFAYFTQIIYFAFVRRIQKEKKHLYTKYAAIQKINIFGDGAMMEQTGHEYDGEIKYSEWSQEQMDKFMAEFEKTKGDKRKKIIKGKRTRSATKK